MKQMVTAVIFLVSALFLLLSGCDNMQGVIDELLSCELNETRPCVCRDGRSGVQVCDPSDAGLWEACVCNDVCVPTTEICDGVDNDCDGLVDEEVPVWILDGDGDKYGVPDSEVQDCIQPVGPYILKDESFGYDCDDTNPNKWTGPVGACADCADADGDDRGDNCDMGPDCDDSMATGQNCWESSDCVLYYLDEDGDGFGITANSRSTCLNAPVPFGDYDALEGGDCDETAECGFGSNPGIALDPCDRCDNDCNPDTPNGWECPHGCNTTPETPVCYANCNPETTSCCDDSGQPCADEECCNGRCDSFSDGWTDRIRIRINSDSVSAALIDFPVYVDLSRMGSYFFENITDPSGADMMVTGSDGISSLPFELLSFNQTEQTGGLYFKADTISGGLDTFFFIYFGGAPNTTNAPTNTWSGYTRVWHLDEEPIGGQIIDAASGNSEGQAVDVTVSDVGIVETANEFVDSYSYVAVPAVADEFDFMGDFSLTAWVYPRRTGTNTVLKKGADSSPSGFSLSLINTGQVLFKNGEPAVGSNLLSEASVPFEEWSLVAVTRSGETLSLYVNGELAGTVTVNTLSLNFDEDLFISNNQSEGGFDGSIDEVRIINGLALSGAAIAAMHKNLTEPELFYSARVENCEDEAPEEHTECETDEDGDGFVSNACEGGNDCDDREATGNSCHNTCVEFFRDQDGDNYGNSELSVTACPEGSATEIVIDDLKYVTDNTDCDDEDVNCSSQTCVTYYQDQDQDTYGNFEVSLRSCTPIDPDVHPGTWVTRDDLFDCNDEDPQKWSGDALNCDSDCVDNDGDGRGDNCDLGADCAGDNNSDIYPNKQWYLDEDGDGYGALASAVVCTGCTCDPETMAIADNNDDCDDDNTVCGENCFPGNPAGDVCDEGGTPGISLGYDNDCDLVIDEDPDWAWYENRDGDPWTNNDTREVTCTMPTTPYGWTRIATENDCDDGKPLCWTQDHCSDDLDGDFILDCEDPCVDADRDGYGTGPECTYSDCDDSLDGGNCNLECRIFYADVDGDGYGSNDFTLVDIRCGFDLLEGWSRNYDDCDDSDHRHWNYGTNEEPPDIPDPTASGKCDADCEDNDEDGYGDFCDMGPDCNDEDGTCHEGCHRYYFDNDGDGYGGLSLSDRLDTCNEEIPPGYVDNALDCNDFDEAMWSGAPGPCEKECTLDDDSDGYGEDCDLGGDCDESDLTGRFCHEGCTIYYADLDGDGFGAGEAHEHCQKHNDGYSLNNTDCNDDNTDPNAKYHWHDCTTCQDNIDQDGYGPGCDLGDDCDEDSLYADASDEDTLFDNAGSCHDSCLPFYRDLDRDGMGDPQYMITACPPVSGEWVYREEVLHLEPDSSPTDMVVRYVPNSDDCDDHYDTGDECDSCTTFYLDADSDGVGGDTPVIACVQPANAVLSTGDCNDDDDEIDPSAVGAEICDNKDNDCDASTVNGEDECASNQICAEYHCDDDEDGWGIRDDAHSHFACSSPAPTSDCASWSTLEGDCNDSSDSVHPEAVDICDELDNDCNEDTANGSGVPGCDCKDYYPDGDGDGAGYYLANALWDCSHPGDGYVDNKNDCWDSNSQVQETKLFYPDRDSDGYGKEDDTLAYCDVSPPANAATQLGDCDNNDSDRAPNKIEECDDKDNDCNDRTPDGSGVEGCEHGCIDHEQPPEGDNCYEECNPLLAIDLSCDHGCDPGAPDTDPSDDVDTSRPAGHCYPECNPALDYDPACEHGGCKDDGTCFPDCNPKIDDCCDDVEGTHCPYCCGVSVCGDGIEDGDNGEECDDGNDINDDMCTNDCKDAECGDGIIQVLNGEKCDGNCPTSAADCDDGIQCTVDNYHPANTPGDCLAFCENVPANPSSTVNCDDGNECNLNDVCNGLRCEGDGEKDCSDDNECTSEYCDPALGCVVTNETGQCEHPDFCLVGGWCNLDGTCGGGTPNCDDNNACTIDSCDETAETCSNTPDVNAPCDDNNLCTINDICSGSGNCEGTLIEQCESGDGCCPAGCTPMTDTDCCGDEPVACNDNNACTTGEICTGVAQCEGEDVICGDDNICTDDLGCDPASGCVYEPNTLPCNDGDICTTDDQCAGGSCQGGPPLDCDDGKFCTDDSCVTGLGCVNEAIQTRLCDDGDSNECTYGQCNADGDCATLNSPLNSVCGSSFDDACTDPDSCDGLGNCRDNHATDGTLCPDEGDPCTYEQCYDGACVHYNVGDYDFDTVCNTVDNCPYTYNPSQGNQDGDSSGDACDSCPNDPNITQGECFDDFRVLMRWAGCEPLEPCNQLKMDLHIVNDSDSDVYLNEFTIRYWFTVDVSFNYQELYCYYAPINCNNIVTSPPANWTSVFHPVSPERPGANYYFEVSFTGNVILYKNGGTTGDMQLAANMQPWGDNYDIFNDYSFEYLVGQYPQESSKITLYRNGVLVWGEEP